MNFKLIYIYLSKIIVPLSGKIRVYEQVTAIKKAIKAG